MATIPSDRQVHTKLEIARPGEVTWIDVSDYLASAVVELGSIEELGTGTGADMGVRTLTFELKNNGANIYFWLIADIVGDSEDAIGSDIDAIGGGQDDVLPWLSTLLGEPKWGRNSFAPRDKMSDWNNHGGTWSPLLWPYRPVSLSVAVTSPGVAPTQWARLFEGYLGDNIATDHHAVSVSCRDKSKRLMDAYIDVKKTYTGPMSAEALIQNIINDHVTHPPTLYCPVASGITFDEMTVEYVSVWDAIKNVAAQMGWFIGYRWNGASFVLTLLEPPRNKTTADYHFDWEDEIYTETLDVNDADIRNALTLVYKDKATGERETLRYTDYPQLRNEESKDEYGGLYRIMQVEEADTSLIDTQAKALSFGEKCIWDLSELSATDKLNLPLLPELDLFSTFTVTNPLISSTTDFFAVQSIRHSLRFGENARFRTEVIATGRVVGAKSKWLDMETRPGRPADPKNKGQDGRDGKDGKDGEDFVPPIPADPVWGSYTLTNALRLTWRKAEHASGYEIRDNLDWGSASGMLFTGYAHDFNFIPTEREMVLYLRAFNVLGEYSVGYDTLNVSLPAPDPPDQPTVEPFFNALKIHPTPLNNPSVMGYFVYVAGDGIDEKLAVIAGGNINYPAPSGATVTIQISAYDIIGEGGKSEPLQATTTALDPLDLPEIPESKLVESLREKINTAYETADDALEVAEDALERIPHIILFSNENQSFLTDSDGVVEAQTVVSSEITVFKGKDLIAATIGGVVVKGSDGTPITAGTITKSNPTYATPGHVTWAIPAGTNVPSDAGYIEVPITVEETTYIKKLYWTKAKRGQIGPQGPQGESAPYARVQYSTAPSGAEWHDTYAEGRKWMRMSTDGGYTWSMPAKIVGEDGADGEDGSYTEYQFAKNTSLTETPSSGWQDSPPAISTSEYLWMRVRAVTPSGAGNWSTPVRISGPKGEKGDPAPTLKVQYSIASSGATWYDDYATGRKWMRTSADNGVTWSTPAKVVGEDGADGEDGSYTEYQFAKNTSLTEAPSSGWQDSPPAISTSEYLWMRVRTVTPSGAGNWSTPVRISGPKGDKGDKGDPGAAARLVTISASQGYFVGKDERVGDEYVRTFTPASITITPEFQHCEYSKWQYSLDGQTFFDVVSGQNGLNIDSVTKALTIGALSPLYGDNRQTVLFRILSTTGEYDQMTIARIYDADNLVDRTQAMETRIEQTDERIALTAERVDETERDIAQHAAQIQILGDEITLKVQRKTNGELVVTGIGVAIDDQGESEVAVLADRFRILGDVEGESQPVFAVDTQTQKIYVIGDLIAEGLIRATEVQAEVIKALLLQAELGVFDEIHGLRIKADKITVGGDAPGLVSTKPANSHLWHFDHSLLSTQGLGPASGTARLIEGGIFGGATWVQSPLEYDTDADTDYTVVVYKSTAKLADYADKTLAELAAM